MKIGRCYPTDNGGSIATYMAGCKKCQEKYKGGFTMYLKASHVCNKTFHRIALGRCIGLALVLFLLISQISIAGADETYTSWIPMGDKNFIGVASSRVFINFIKINKPPKVVLDYVSDLMKLPEWYPDAQYCRVVKGPEGGRPMKPGDVTLEVIGPYVTKEDPTAGVEYTCTARVEEKLFRIEGRRFRGGKVSTNVVNAATYLTYPEPDGGTTYLRIWELFHEGQYDYNVFKMDKEQLHRHFQKGLEKLKAVLEARP
jgi:hypothetical protein